MELAPCTRTDGALKSPHRLAEWSRSQRPVMSTSPLPPSDPADPVTLPPTTADAEATRSWLSASTDAAAAPVPDAVPGYELLGELGRGGMGVVYKARQTKLHRVVALKMVLAGGHASSAELARFLNEAEAVARMQQPNIVQIFETRQHNGLPS